jgi:hypothetical protein
MKRTMGSNYRVQWVKRQWHDGSTAIAVRGNRKAVRPRREMSEANREK